MASRTLPPVMAVEVWSASAVAGFGAPVPWSGARRAKLGLPGHCGHDFLEDYVAARRRPGRVRGAVTAELSPHEATLKFEEPHILSGLRTIGDAPREHPGPASRCGRCANPASPGTEALRWPWRDR